MPEMDNQVLDNLAQVAREVTEGCLGGPVIGLTPIIGLGDVNSVYRVELRDRQVILRVREGGLAEFRKEAWCIARARAVGVPGPEVLAVGESGGVAFMIESCVPGVAGHLCGLPQREVWCTLGRYAREINRVNPGDFYGDLVGSSGAFGSVADYLRPTWPTQVSYAVECIGPHDRLFALGVYRLAEALRIRSLLAELLVRPFTFGLIHGDLSLANCWVTDAGVVTLIDWGCARVHVAPHFEINLLLDDPYDRPVPMLDAFLDGYGITREALAGMQDELDMVWLFFAFDRVRWAIDRCPRAIEENSAFAAKVKTRVLGK